PTQIEEAIETLDAQTESDPPLVRQLGATPPTLPAPSDLFERIRDGFALEDVDDPSIDKEQSWFARHAAYLDRTFKRGERYLYHIVNEIEARDMPMELALLPVVESALTPSPIRALERPACGSSFRAPVAATGSSRTGTTTVAAMCSRPRPPRSTTWNSWRMNS